MSKKAPNPSPTFRKPPPPPNPPLNRIILESGGAGVCPKCGSSVVRKYWLLGEIECIHPQCGEMTMETKHPTNIVYFCREMIMCLDKKTLVDLAKKFDIPVHTSSDRAKIATKLCQHVESAELTIKWHTIEQ